MAVNTTGHKNTDSIVTGELCIAAISFAIDILKTDVEGLWWEFGQELLEKNIDFKYWVTEIEFNVGYSNDEILDNIEDLCKQFKNKGYEVYTNRVRDNKRVCELIFVSPLFK